MIVGGPNGTAGFVFPAFRRPPVLNAAKPVSL